MSGPDRARALIVTSLPEELRPILSGAKHRRSGRGSWVEARIGAADVVLAATGDGARKAGHAAAGLCDAVRPAALIGAGAAGALSRELSIGDLVVARRIRDSWGEAPAPDETLVSRAQAAGARAASLVTVERPAVGAAEKAALAASLDSGGPAAVDMESGGWARAAAAREIPYVVVRSISDLAEEELPAYLARCVGEDGSVRRSAVVGHALARPMTIPALLKMRRRINQCGQRLGAFLEEFLAHGI
jgi:adenosylhomocysteine nucleosidase